MRGHVGQNATAGTWFITYDEPRAADGRRRQRKKSGFKSQRGAERYLTSALASIDQGSYVSTDSGTVGQFLLDEFLPSQGHLRASTRRTYEGYLRNRIVPGIGQVQLGDLRPSHLQRLYADLVAAGLSPQTVRHVHAIVRRAFNRAVDWGRLPLTPVRGLDLPRTHRRELRTWSPTEAKTFLQSVAGDRDGALYTVLLTSGLRRGELLGVRWADVRWHDNALQITQQLVQSGKELHIGPPKTRRSERVVALDDNTMQVLRQHRAKQAEEQLAWGPGYTTSGLIFTREDGSCCIPSSVSRRWLTLQEGLDLPRLRLHDARHTHATLALEAGVPLTVVSERLGHSTITLTANTYGHVRPAVAREAADKVGGLLFD